jgi:2',3'-cyclic-nucleotide 2'-phosphodiesterase (5'-nucleotidase family)
VNQTAIVQAGLHGNFLGHLDLELDETSGRVTHYELLPCAETVPPDPTLSGMLELIRFEAQVLQKKSNNG